ncbi:MAG: YbaB/EbfC family nucleoid-associated protein [Alphaproteobacteria bacterium]
MMNMQNLMKQAQAMQAKMMAEQEKLKQEEFSGTSGGSMVSVIINGEYELKKLNLDKSLINADEVDILEDLIIAAFNDAKKKADAKTKDSMSALTGGMKLPF